MSLINSEIEPDSTEISLDPARDVESALPIPECQRPITLEYEWGYNCFCLPTPSVSQDNE